MSPYSASVPGFQSSAGRMLRFMGVSTLGAFTPTNRTVAPGCGRRRSRTLRRLGRLERSAGDRERRAQAGDVEDLAGGGLEAPELDGAAALAGPLERPDEHAQAGRVDEIHPREVDDDRGRAPLDQAVQLVTERRCGGDIHLALDHDRRLSGLVLHRDAKALVRRQVRAVGDHGGRIPGAYWGRTSSNHTLVPASFEW